MIKQVLKKVVATALAMSCALSLVQTFEPMNAKAKIEYNVFQNKHSVEDCGIGFVTEKKQVELLDETVTKKSKKRTKRYIFSKDLCCSQIVISIFMHRAVRMQEERLFL